jgi:hypothetical protein
MVESIPSAPYTHELGSLLNCESNMNLRRHKLNAWVKTVDPTAVAVTIVSFPLLGVGDYYTPNFPEIARNEITNSQCLHDCIISLHPRY